MHWSTSRLSRQLRESPKSAISRQVVTDAPCRWAYTAGAYYRDVFGSLIFGGYDETRFRTNNQTFAFDSMVSRDLTVSLRSIIYDTAGASPLLTSSVNIFINSLVTEIWLPLETCNAFQQQFNLTWNPQGQLYLIDEVAHAALVAQNPSFTFTLGQSGVSNTS